MAFFRMLMAISSVTSFLWFQLSIFLVTWGGLARLAGLARFAGISARLWNTLKLRDYMEKFQPG